MIQRWSRHLLVALAAGAALAASGCGDDDGGGGGGGRPDARPHPDAQPDEPDAGGQTDAGGQADAGGDPDGGDQPTLLRSGTIAVTEAAISNPGFDTFSGALVRVDFSDATTGNIPAPVEGFESPINGCLIRIWDVGTHENSDSVDEGAVQVIGSDNGDFACGFVGARNEYLCQSTTPAIAAGSLDGVTIVNNVMTFPAAGTQTAAPMVGMHMILTGFPNIPDGARLPIVGRNGPADSLQLFGLPAIDLGAGDADATFANLVGVGPVPGGAQFLRGAADDIGVQKAAGDVVGAIDESFSAHGQGFELVNNAATDRYLPHNLPFDGSPVTFECDGAGCGEEGDGGLIEAIVINGETTDGAVGGSPNPADPMPAPETQYATFQCAFIGADAGTLDADAMAAILGTSPTRIQTSVGRHRGAIVAAEDGTSSTILLQGHAVLGWADAPPE